MSKCDCEGLMWLIGAVVCLLAALQVVLCLCVCTEILYGSLMTVGLVPASTATATDGDDDDDDDDEAVGAEAVTSTSGLHRRLHRLQR